MGGIDFSKINLFLGTTDALNIASKEGKGSPLILTQIRGFRDVVVVGSG